VAHPAARHPHEAASSYERHRPEETVLYRTLAAHWAEFCERAEEAGGLPRFVQREVDEYLRCGQLEYGCVRVGCERCGLERLIAFSRKRRGFCPSCLGRRMSDTAVHLAQKVIPAVPVRQWVCSARIASPGLLPGEARRGHLLDVSSAATCVETTPQAVLSRVRSTRSAASPSAACSRRSVPTCLVAVNRPGSADGPAL
jgi:hypothetical protein